MNHVIDFFSFITTRIVNILDSIRIDGSLSLLHYFLGAILISFIIKLVKGGSTEFEQRVNFFNSKIDSAYSARYQSNKERERQVKEQKKVNHSFVYGFTAGMETAHGNSDAILSFADKAGYVDDPAYDLGGK